MNDIRSAKSVVRKFHSDLETYAGKAGASAGDRPGAGDDAVADVLARHTALDWLWRGVHPFHDLRGPSAVAKAFWAPLMEAFTRLQRRPDIFLAGRNEMDGFSSTWVVSMGHLLGLFDRPWLGIRPTGRIAMLRYAEFDRVEDGRIVESAMFCDIPHLMIQAGQNPFPPQTGAHLVQPGPRTHDGLMWDEQDPREGKRTLALMGRMLKGSGRDYHHPDEARLLAEHWHDDMIWWGPAGIGTAYTIEGYRRQHTRPFDDAFAEGDEGGKPDLCRIGEGSFGALAGFGNMRLRSAGGWLGMTAAAKPIDLRVVDIYRREGGRLAENWVFIDLLDYLARQGFDVLARNAETRLN